MKILIAEDEQRAREGLRKLLESISGDHEVVAQVSNGQTALEMILQLKVDVVFTDLKMPFLDGLSLIRAVRAHRLRTEFVVISAYADFEFARQAISLDVVEYILKPLSREEVEGVLKRLHSRLEGSWHCGSRSHSGLREKFPDAHPLVLRALDMIQSGYAGKINQKDLAKQLGISPEYFSYLFSKHIGETFSTFLRNYRIEQAQELYRSGSCDRKDVPYAVGFSDAKYFNQVFRKVTGVTPTEYIQQFT